MGGGAVFSVRHRAYGGGRPPGSSTSASTRSASTPISVFSLIRIRENSESIALYRGEPREREYLPGPVCRGLSATSRQIMRRTRRLNWWVSGYGQGRQSFSRSSVSMPAYFAKVIQIGTIMQISSAFGQVQGALWFIVNSYTDLASWHAVVDRLRFFQQAMDKVDSMRNAHAHIERRNGPALRLRGVNVRLPNGRELVRGLDLELGRPVGACW